MLRKLIVGLLSLYVFIYIFAVPMLLLNLVPPWGTWMGGFLNVLQGGLMALWLAANAGWRGATAALWIWILALAVEYVGVTTGVPFGRYIYTDMLGLKLDGAVPLPIPFAWLLVVPGAISTARLLGIKGRMLISAAPLLIVLFDLLLEPFAVYILGYWTWLEYGPYYNVPSTNFLAWGAVGLALTLLVLLLCGRRVTHAPVLPQLPALLFVLNILQFTLVDLVKGFGLAALIGSAFLIGGGWCVRTQIGLWRHGWSAALAELRRTTVETEPE